jgi:hypothetical protein
LAENLLGLGSGSGRFQKSNPDPDPVKNRPDPQHWLYASACKLTELHIRMRDFTLQLPTSSMILLVIATAMQQRTFISL